MIVMESTFFFQMGGLTTNQLLIDFQWQNCMKLLNMLPYFIPNLPKYQKLGSLYHGEQTRLYRIHLGKL